MYLLFFFFVSSILEIHEWYVIKGKIKAFYWSLWYLFTFFVNLSSDFIFNMPNRWERKAWLLLACWTVLVRLHFFLNMWGFLIIEFFSGKIPFDKDCVCVGIASFKSWTKWIGVGSVELIRYRHVTLLLKLQYYQYCIYRQIQANIYVKIFLSLLGISLQPTEQPT